jgi:divalent metal cation (Fe/Co/Zn/Cd) transporter
VIGVLLCVVAVVLAIETKSLLLGESAVPGAVETIERTLAASPGIDRVIHLRTMHLGPDQLLIGAKIAVAADLSLAEVSRTIDAAEAAVRAQVDIDCVIYLEPDVDRAAEQDSSTPSTTAVSSRREDQPTA